MILTHSCPRIDACDTPKHLFTYSAQVNLTTDTKTSKVITLVKFIENVFTHLRTHGTFGKYN